MERKRFGESDLDQILPDPCNILPLIRNLFHLDNINLRFCTPLVNCPAVDAAWQDPQGVPVSGNMSTY